MIVAIDIVKDLSNWGDGVGHIWPLFILAGGILAGFKKLLTTAKKEVSQIIKSETAPLRKELTTNGGGSIKDAVKRIEDNFAQHDITEREDSRVRLVKFEEMDKKLDKVTNLAEKAYKESTLNGSKMSAVLANMEAAYYEMNADGKVTDVNDAYLDLFGITSKEATSSTEWRKHIPAEDLDMIDRTGAIAQENQSEWFCKFNVIRNGVKIPVIGRAKPLFEGTEFVGFAGAMTYDRDLLHAP